MKASGFILGLSIVVTAPASSLAQVRTPQATPMWPTLMPGTAPQPTPMAPTLTRPPAAAPPQTGCQTHLELVCNIDNFCQHVPVCSQ